MAQGGGVAARADVVGALSLEVGAAATFIASQESGPGTMTGGARKWLWGGNRDGGWRGGTPLRGSLTFHKGSSDPGSKSR